MCDDLPVWMQHKCSRSTADSISHSEMLQLSVLVSAQFTASYLRQQYLVDIQYGSKDSSVCRYYTHKSRRWQVSDWGHPRFPWKMVSCLYSKHWLTTSSKIWKPFATTVLWRWRTFAFKAKAAVQLCSQQISRSSSQSQFPVYVALHSFSTAQRVAGECLQTSQSLPICWQTQQSQGGFCQPVYTDGL